MSVRFEQLANGAHSAYRASQNGHDIWIEHLSCGAENGGEGWAVWLDLRREPIVTRYLTTAKKIAVEETSR